MFLLGGEVADAYPLVVVKSDTVRVSVLPVAGCKFPAVFLGKVAFDVVGLGVGPPCLRVDSEETLLTVIDSGDSFNMGTIITGALCCVRRRGF